VFTQQQLFATRTGTAHVDGREHALLRHLAVEVQFHVASALEFLVDHLVHLRTGVDQTGGDDGQAAAFLDIACCTEETFRTLQGVGVHTTGQYLAGGGDDRVVGACETRDGVEQDDHVFLVLDQALGLLDDHFGHLYVTRGRLVEGRSHHFAAHRALHFRHFLRTLVDQQHDQAALGRVARDRLRDVLQDQRLAGLRRRYDQAALALADGGYEINDAGTEVFGAAVAGFQREAFVGEERGKVFEQDFGARVFRLVEVDRIHLEQREVALAFLRWPDRAGD